MEIDALDARNEEANVRINELTEMIGLEKQKCIDAV
jgi:hypothetical protein